MDLLTSIEQSGFATWVRESDSLWAYPGILFLHTIGLGFLVGIGSAINLRVLGVASDMAIAPMEKYFPVMAFGFWMTVVSGLALVAADATVMARNPVFYIKMICIALALVSTWLLKTRVFGETGRELRPIPASSRWFACTSFLFWAGAITAGRLTAYIGY